MITPKRIAATAIAETQANIFLAFLGEIVVGADDGAKEDVGENVGADVGAKEDVGVDVGADVGADEDVGEDVGGDEDEDVGADVEEGEDVGEDEDEDIGADVGDVGADVGICVEKEIDCLLGEGEGVPGLKVRLVLLANECAFG